MIRGRTSAGLAAARAEGRIVDLAGDPSDIRAALGWLQAGPFKERDAWLVVSDGRGMARIESLTTIAAPTQDSAA